MSLKQEHATASEADFISRVEQAAIATAIAVCSEAGNTAGHAKRAAFANDVLHYSRNAAKKLAHGIMTQPGMIPEVTDQEIRDTVAAVWNAYAGYNPNG